MPRKPTKKSKLNHKAIARRVGSTLAPTTAKGEAYAEMAGTKKSPAKRMKPFKAWCIVHKTLGTPDRDVCDGGNTLWPTRFSLLQCVGDDYRPARVLVTELPTPTVSPTGDEGRTIEEIRKLAVRWRDKSTGLVLHAAGEDILRILNSTPTAKGGRK